MQHCDWSSDVCSSDLSKYTKYINEYSKVQYNGLFDKKHRVEDFFFLKDGDYQVKEDN